MDYFIWKPSTGIYRKLPDLEVPFVEVFIYGFGYDLFSNEYGAFVRVLSMKANSWRKIHYYDAISYICPRRLEGALSMEPSTGLAVCLIYRMSK